MHKVVRSEVKGVPETYQLWVELAVPCQQTFSQSQSVLPSLLYCHSVFCCCSRDINSPEIIARTHARVELAHFPARCIIRAWEAWGHRPCSFQVLTMHQVGKCAISTWAWVLGFYPMTSKKYQSSHVEIEHFHTPCFCMNCILVMG